MQQAGVGWFDNSNATDDVDGGLSGMRLYSVSDLDVSQRSERRVAMSGDTRITQ
jgi:hypothetical protein